MKKSKVTLILVAVGVVVVGILITCVMFLNKDNSTPSTTTPSVSTTPSTSTTPVTPSYDVNKVMQGNVDIAISNVKYPDASQSTADVTLTMPDVLKIYKKLSETVSPDSMSMEAIRTAISEYAQNPDYIVQRTTTEDVQKEGNQWVLVSDEHVQEVVADMSEKLLIQIINEVGVIEIESIDLGGTT